MPYVNVDVDVDDFYDDLSSWEKEELISLLKKDGLLESKRLVEIDGDEEEATIGSPLDYEWVAMINKINEARYQLTSEQEQVLINLAKSL
jgi:hypothetical protein